MKALATLLSPLRYLKAVNSTKRMWDVWIPAASALLVLGATELIPGRTALLADRGLVYAVNELLQVLVGFYIASLAAVASFSTRSLDQPIRGEGVSLARPGRGESKKLSRREFLSLLFAYLAFLAIALYLIGMGAQLFWPALQVFNEEIWFPWVRRLLAWGYLFLVAQLVCVTLVGLYYLGDRIHRQDPEPLPPEDVNDD